MSHGDEPEYITWQLFEGEENLGGYEDAHERDTTNSSALLFNDAGLGDQVRKGEVEIQRSAC